MPCIPSLTRVVNHPIFENFILAVIVANAICLALDTPANEDNENLQDFLEYADLVFVIIFAIEMCLKMLAFGLFSPMCGRCQTLCGTDEEEGEVEDEEPPEEILDEDGNKKKAQQPAYFCSVWNCIDFVVVVLGFLSLFPSVGNYTAIRLVRVLRPLRTISRVAGMRILMNSLVHSLPGLFDVFLLLLFFLFIFAILGVQLWEGDLHQRCYYKVTPQTPCPEHQNATWCLLQSSEALCSNGTFGRPCVPEKTHYSGEQQCMVDTTQFKNKILNYDTIGNGLLLVFKIISTDDWPADQINMQNASAHHVWIYFLILTVFGSFFTINLILAVLNNVFANESDKRRAELKKQKEERKKKEKEEKVRRRGGGAESAAYVAEVNERKRNPISRCWHKLMPSDSRKTKAAWRQKLERLVKSSQFNVCMLTLTYANVIMLSLDHYNAPEWLENIMDVSNLIAAFLFALEAIIKILALGIRVYFSDTFNAFDFILVVISIPEFFLAQSSRFTAFRAFRLGRVFRLARRWESLRHLLLTIFKSLTSVLYLALIMLLFIFIFSILGLQVFSEAFDPDEEAPRTNFQSLWESGLTVFVVFTGESWATIMKDAMLWTHWSACFYFLGLFIFGNYILINLFIAILIESFANDEEQDEEEDDEDEEDMFPMPVYKEGENVCDCTRCGGTDENGQFQHKGSQPRKFSATFPECTVDNAQVSGALALLAGTATEGSHHRHHHLHRDPRSRASPTAGGLPFGDGFRSVVGIDAVRRDDDDPTQSGVVTLFNDEIDDAVLHQKTGLTKFRAKLKATLKSQYFDGYLVVALILVNAVFLALDYACVEEKNPALAEVLEVADKVFTAIFTVEALLKIFAFGIKAYFSNRWDLLDFFVVLTSIAGLFLDWFSVFRALRTLRLTTRSSGMKIVVEALLEALPSMWNVVIICIFIWLVFGILGVQLFKGTFYECNDTTKVLREQCIGVFDKVVVSDIPGEPVTTVRTPRLWLDPPYGFDHIFIAMLTLFQVGVGEGWADIMYAGIDATEANKKPKRNNAPWNSLYFVGFMVVGGFFMMNLFVGALIDHYLRGAENHKSMTIAQQNWVQAAKLVKDAKHSVLKAPPKMPTNPARRFLYVVTSHHATDTFITACILVNVIFMSIQHWKQPQTISDVLDKANLVFVIIFTVEAILKIIALGLRYFQDYWNVFDFIIVVVSWIGVVFGGVGTSSIRIFRIGRVFRLIKKAKGLQQLFSTLVYALPSLLNIAVLLIVIFFIFGVMGVQLFGKIRHNEEITDDKNFENLGQAVLILYQIATTETWPNVMDSCTRKAPPECEYSPHNTCGTNSAYAFFVIFMIVGSFIMLNLFITVVMAHFSQADFEQHEKLHHFNLFRERWLIYDPEATGKMPVDDFIQLWRTHPKPLGLQPELTEQQISDLTGEELDSRPPKPITNILPLLVRLYAPIYKNNNAENSREHWIVQYTDIVAAMLRYKYKIDIEQARSLPSKAQLTKVPDDHINQFWVHQYYAAKMIEWLFKWSKPFRMLCKYYDTNKAVELATANESGDSDCEGSLASNDLTLLDIKINALLGRVDNMCTGMPAPQNTPVNGAQQTAMEKGIGTPPLQPSSPFSTFDGRLAAPPAAMKKLTGAQYIGATDVELGIMDGF